MCGRNPRQIPARTADASAGLSLVRQAQPVGERVVVGEEGRGADPDDPSGQPVQAVDEVDRVDGDHHDQDGDRDLLIAGEAQRGPVGRGSQVTSAPLQTRITPAATWPTSLLITPIPQRSSTKPMTTIRPPASSRPLAMLVSANTLFREGSWLATTSPAASPAYMAKPRAAG